MLNHVVLMGRLTRDPELRRTGTGLAVASFCVAVDRDWPNKETGEKETDFINCVAWRQTGEFVSKWFTKGSMIVVSGRLQMRNWTDKDGNKRVSAEIVADNVYFGEGKKDKTESTANPYTTATYNTPSYGGYSGPWMSGGVKPASDFAMLDDDDAQLPF
jgi:single-strand DNA-binding protein